MKSHGVHRGFRERLWDRCHSLSQYSKGTSIELTLKCTIWHAEDRHLQYVQHTGYSMGDLCPGVSVYNPNFSHQLCQNLHVALKTICGFKTLNPAGPMQWCLQHSECGGRDNCGEDKLEMYMRNNGVGQFSGKFEEKAFAFTNHILPKNWNLYRFRHGGHVSTSVGSEVLSY